MTFSGKWRTRESQAGRGLSLAGPPSLNPRGAGHPQSLDTPRGWSPYRLEPQRWPVQGPRGAGHPQRLEPQKRAAQGPRSFSGGHRTPGLGGVVSCVHTRPGRGRRRSLNTSQRIWQRKPRVLGRVLWSGLGKVSPSQTLVKGGPKARVAVPKAGYFPPESLPLCFCTGTLTTCMC